MNKGRTIFLLCLMSIPSAFSSFAYKAKPVKPALKDVIAQTAALSLGYLLWRLYLGQERVHKSTDTTGRISYRVTDNDSAFLYRGLAVSLYGIGGMVESLIHYYTLHQWNNRTYEQVFVDAQKTYEKIETTSSDLITLIHNNRENSYQLVEEIRKMFKVKPLQRAVQILTSKLGLLSDHKAALIDIIKNCEEGLIDMPSPDVWKELYLSFEQLEICLHSYINSLKALPEYKQEVMSN